MSTFEGQPDTSWLHGKYPFGEINTKLPYVVVYPTGKLEPGESFEPIYYAQGDDADETIKQIHEIWLADGRRTTQTAFKHWINLYL